MQAKTAEDGFCVSSFTHTAVDAGAQRPVGKHWVVKESSSRIHGCRQCLEHRIMSHSAHIHYIWDVNYEVAGGRVISRKANRQMRDRLRRAGRKVQNFCVKTFFQLTDNQKSLLFFQVSLSATNKNQRVGHGQVPAVTWFQGQVFNLKVHHFKLYKYELKFCFVLFFLIAELSRTGVLLSCTHSISYKSLVIPRYSLQLISDCMVSYFCMK